MSLQLMQQIVASTILAAILTLVAWFVLGLVAPRPHAMTAEEAEWDYTEGSAAIDFDLSIVVPAYNESQRLPLMLDAAFKYLNTRKDLRLELIVVDDGSRDGTSRVAADYARQRNQPGNPMRVLRL